MIPRALRGLRGRLLLALLVTSAATLAVAAAVTLSPLQDRLREQSVTSLEGAVEDLSGDFATALAKHPPPPGGEIDPTTLKRASADEYEDARKARLQDRSFDVFDPAFALRERTDARVLVLDPSMTAVSGEAPGFLYDTDNGLPQQDAMNVAVKALLEGRTVVEADGGDLSIAKPLLERGAVSGVVVAQRRLTEVTAAVNIVRNALLAAAGIGLAVAIALALGLSGTLTRRLGRLQRAALRIAAEGPEAPAPRDSGRDEVGDLARTLARMQEELRRQEAARRSFVATASHELRTPLTMLQGTMELLDEDLRNGLDITDAQEQVMSARRELRRLSALASELLDLSRLDAAVQLRSEPVELGELARAVAAEFDLRASERDVRVAVAPPAEPAWARGDPAACARVVRILLDNALRYAPRGEPVTVGVESADGRVTVEVADRGPGVPPDERDRIFERFHRGREAGEEAGFGLGLAIGRELAELMGGSLTLAGADAGARFRLTLPATSGSSPAPSPAPGSAAAA